MRIKTKFDGYLEWTEYQEQLVNRVYKILPLMEEKRDWKKYLAGLLVELAGLEDLSDQVDFTSLNGKLNGLYTLTKDQINDGLFRKEVFDSVTLVKKIQLK
jgi:hypothetical protein